VVGVFVSVGVRAVVNVEALNAVETVGNVTKHRRAPIVLKGDKGYRLIYVPAASGESLANAFQRNLVKAAKLIYGAEGLKPPITEWDERFEFVKFMDKAHLTPALKKLVAGKASNIPEAKHEFELQAIRESIVADVAGFLYAEEELPVKRTSRLQVGYVVPTYDSIEAVAIEAQFHARHVPAETTKRKTAQVEAAQKAQMIYYVEVASATYGITINLDVDGIGRTSLVRVEDAVDGDERARRVRASLLALAALLAGEGFGAKLSRFLPVKTVESAVASISTPVAFTVSPPQRPDYISDTAARAGQLREVLKKLGVESSVELIAYSKEVPEGLVKAGSIEDLMLKVIDRVLKG